MGKVKILISLVFLFVIEASCSKTTKKEQCSSSRQKAKHQKVQTFVAPPPSGEQLQSAAKGEEEIVKVNSVENISDGKLNISPFAYYVPEDSNQRVVRPELIEKYRRARNNNIYVNKYPIDWVGIMKDRGLKTPKESKASVRRSKKYNCLNIGNYYRPAGLFSFIPYFTYGWNSQNGWSPNVGVMVTPRVIGFPVGNVAWNGVGKGVNFSMNYPMPFYYQNIYHNQRQFGNPYYNNIYNQQLYNNTPVVVQGNGIVSKSDSLQIKNASTDSNISSNKLDYSDGVGGPEKYTRQSKKIEDYKVKVE